MIKILILVAVLGQHPHSTVSPRMGYRGMRFYYRIPVARVVPAPAKRIKDEHIEPAKPLSTSEKRELAAYRHYLKLRDRIPHARPEPPRDHPMWRYWYCNEQKRQETLRYIEKYLKQYEKYQQPAPSQ